LVSILTVVKGTLPNASRYAGAYTNQICQIDADAGNSLVHLGVVPTANNDTFLTTWYNNCEYSFDKVQVM